MLESREYQDEALAAIEEEWAKGNTRTAVVLPTGMGKTIVFARLTKDRAALGKVLILVHRDELARSAAQKLHSVAPELEIGIVKAERNDVDAPVIIGSVQTLARQARRSPIHDVATIIVDEAHHAVAKTYLDILDHFGAFLPGKSPSSPGPTPTAGFSATLARDDHRGLGKVWQSVAYRKAIVWGIAKGYLADVQATRVVLDDLDLNDVPVNRGDYQEDELGRALLGINAGPRIAEAWQAHAGERQGFLFTPNVATAHQFAHDFEAVGISTATITGKTPIEERVNAYARFQQGKIRTLVNCMVLTEGFDMPQASVACIARATRSRNLYVQMAGRVLRPWPGKDKALLLDVVGVTAEQKLASIVDLAEGPGDQAVRDHHGRRGPGGQGSQLARGRPGRHASVQGRGPLQPVVQGMAQDPQGRLVHPDQAGDVVSLARGRAGSVLGSALSQGRTSLRSGGVRDDPGLRP
jgi:superfamily II DNA or RNA helicase